MTSGRRLRLLAPALVAALALAAGSARAGEELDLTWQDCPLGGGGHNATFTCNSNIGENDLFCSFRMPYPADSVIGVEIVVDVQHSESPMPDWWRFDPGGCRQGSLGASFDFSTHFACTDFWFETPAGGLSSYTLGEPRGQSNQARILVAAQLLSQNYRQLDDTSLYYAAILQLRHTNTVIPPAECAGCASAACLVFNGLLVRRLPGAPGGDITISTPAPAGGNIATWQGNGADCQAVPARATSWGQVKGLYR